MSHADEEVTIADLLTAFADGFGLRPRGQWKQNRPVTQVALFQDSANEDITASTLVIAASCDGSNLRDAAQTWTDSFPILILTESSAADFGPNSSGDLPIILAPETFSATNFIAEVSRWLDPSETVTARRLAGIQARFNLALTHVDPMQDLFKRVSRQLGGTVALIDDTKRILSSSGPLPMSQVTPALEDNAAPVVKIESEQWSGAAIRVSLGTKPGSQGSGWLIGLVPAPHRFDTTQLAALQLAAPLFDTILLLRSATQEQEHAVNSALLVETLAFRPQRHDAELQGKLLGTGIAFKDDLHVVVLQPKTAHLPTFRRQLKQLLPELKQALDSSGIRSLVTGQDQQVVVLAQASLGEIRRILTATGNKLGEVRMGAGRTVRSVADIAASYQDGMLALRIDGMSQSPRSFVAVANFDYAFRLFSEVGLDQMIEWATSFFAPLWERDTLLTGLQAYFAFDQNMNAAAKALGIHHNSLRYRIAKAEEGLGLSLRSPSAITSVFLAITALELGHQLRQFAPRGAVKSSTEQIATGETIAPRSPDGQTHPNPSSPGVVISGDQ
ncbi:helix-turn-helix domain-containing protein [Brevibacterium sp.]|uniref:PucR family transcriptional regulator n=1 Tax=Brevibacterium sp. TaxID=1701 RepID=UPI0028124888|nr:helix-turn-helix domain-containing protein [Brevibacterium sp.]